MNIAFFSHYGGKGGANIELTLLVREMIKKGHKIIVVTPEKGWLYEELCDECRFVVIPYHRWVENGNQRVTFVRKAAKFLVNWLAAFYISRALKKEAIQIVHTNDSITVVGAYVAELLELPHIWHMREIFDEQFSFQHTFSESYCNKWMKRAERVIAISDSVKQRYELYDGLRITRVYDGLAVPNQKFHFKKSKRLEILFCGGTSMHKGFPDVLELAKRLQMEQEDFHINIASSYEIDASLRNTLRKFSLEKKMTFLGFVDDLEKMRQKSDVLLMCSRDEAFGLVTVEGMLSKVLVIGRKSGATMELIKDGVTGYLYENIDELVAIVKKVRTQDNTPILERAHSYAIDNFSIRSTANNIQKIYEEVI